MSLGWSILETAMVLSFVGALIAMVFDVCTQRRLSDKAVKVITALYLWPIAIVGVAAVGLALALIWA